MSKGPWKSKQPPSVPDSAPASPLKEIAELFLEHSAKQQSLAQTDGHISAWFRTIGMRSGEIPLPNDNEAA